MPVAQRLMLLRLVLLADAIVLVLLGVLLIVLPQQMFDSFGLSGMAPSAYYLAGMWGALLATMGLGYSLAARDPGQSQYWVLIGIIRAVIEVLVSVNYLWTHVVTLQNVWLGLLLAVVFALAYAALYPRSAAPNLTERLPVADAEPGARL